jgi:hypothetical protein
MSDTFKAVWYAAAVSRFLIVNKTARILLANSVSAAQVLYTQSSETHKFFVWRVRQQYPHCRKDTEVRDRYCVGHQFMRRSLSLSLRHAVSKFPAAST